MYLQGYLVTHLKRSNTKIQYGRPHYRQFRHFSFSITEIWIHLLCNKLVPSTINVVQKSMCTCNSCCWSIYFVCTVCICKDIWSLIWKGQTPKSNMAAPIIGNIDPELNEHLFLTTRWHHTTICFFHLCLAISQCSWIFCQTKPRLL